MNQSKSLIKEKLEKLSRESEERDAQRKANKGGFFYINLTTPININALSLINEETSREARVAAFEIKEKKVALAVYQPNNIKTKEIIEKLKNDGYNLSIFIVSLSTLNHILSFYQFTFKEVKEITGSVEIEEKRFLELKNLLVSIDVVKKELSISITNTTTATKILEIILAGALSNRASDIHFEPAEHNVNLRLRVDGLLCDIFKNLDKGIYERLLSRIKLLSRLKLNINDEPQDGRFSISLPDKVIEIRTSIIPSEFGETVVLRILDPDAIKLNFSDLGFWGDNLEIIKKELLKPNGMILNTGPTGSGKTTTLYAFLKNAQSPEIKIITIEDPIEYHIDGIEQTQVNPSVGYTFSNGLRSILRQDPDMILVGEIRDLETAQIAMHSALTGHLVFSTLHANEASGAIPRLIDMGIKPSVIASAINLIIAQRLVRRLCQNCRQKQEISYDIKNKIDIFLKKLPDKINKNFQEIKIFKSLVGGCEKCNNIGYKGRIGIFELFLMNPDLEKLITKESTELEIKELAFKQGMISMQKDGILRVLQGETTFEEVEKITGSLEW